MDQPHILVTGDAWQYVPFGRARLKSLRATGLSYASQSYTVDGTTIKVRIVGDQSFIQIDGSGTLYLESGQLEWNYPAPESPTRYDPAQWHFLDVPTTSTYLGKVRADGTQVNKPTLCESQDSLAIGYPKATTGTPAEIAAADWARKIEYGGATVAKKLMLANFPASLFSGKMRLFMQSQYGAAESLKPRLQLGLSGTSLTLSFTNNGILTQIGFWTHMTTGVFRTTDGHYFLVNLALGTTSTTVTYYPISLGPASRAFAIEYRDASAADQIKLEAYLFAHSTVQTAKGKTITLDVGAAGAPLAYGWKFNSDGSEARIVVNHAQDPANSDVASARYRARTATVRLAYANGEVSATGVVTSAKDWIDGWGSYNIFVPETELSSAPLGLFSIRASATPPPFFEFGTTEIYGYFIGDAWQSFTVDYKEEGGSTHQTSNALFVNPSDESLAGNYQYSYNFANVGLSHFTTEIFTGSGMTLTAGGIAYGGFIQNGRWTSRTTSTSGGAIVDNPVDYCGNFVGGNYGGPTVPGYMYSVGGGANGGGFIEGGPMTRTVTEFTGTKYYVWALIIPGKDCCAAYVATREDGREGAYTKTDVTVPESAIRFSGSLGSYVPWKMSWEWGTWFGYGPGTSVTYITTPAAPEAILKVHGFNTAVAGVEGTPGGGLTALFDCSYSYPFYDRGMYTFTSYGGRYLMSEGLKSPASVNDDQFFVGWI